MDNGMLGRSRPRLGGRMMHCLRRRDLTIPRNGDPSVNQGMGYGANHDGTIDENRAIDANGLPSVAHEDAIVDERMATVDITPSEARTIAVMVGEMVPRSGGDG